MDEFMSYYVYIYLDPRHQENLSVLNYSFDYRPIYVGKGAYAKRAYQHLGDKTDSHKSRTIQKILSLGIQPIILKLQYFETNDEAIDHEIALIAEIGTFAEVDGVKRGPLTNMTRGGDRASGRKVSDHAMKVYKDRRGEKNPFFGKQHTEEHKRERSLKYSGENHPCYGIAKSDETKRKISESKIGGESWNKGIERTAEDKVKISEKTKIAMNNPATKQRISAASSGRKVINKDGKNKSIKIEELPIYLNDGWQLGRVSSTRSS
jgi:hypothetical protein